MLIIHRYEIQQIFHSLNLLLKYYTGQKGRSVCDEFAWFVGVVDLCLQSTALCTGIRR